MKFALVRHPDTPSNAIQSVEIEITATDWDDVLLTFAVEPSSTLVLSAWETPARADGLWKTTCFELFLRPADGDAYFEFNLSPSSKWAAYAFETYRAGMRDVQLAVEPQIQTAVDKDQFKLEADVDFSVIPNVPLRAGISAVIEEVSGTKSYWALRHPPGKPDFHHPDCFALQLPAPDAP